MRKFGLLITFVALLSLDALGQSIKTKTAKGVDITKYETFTVMKGEFMTPPEEQKIDEEELFQAFRKATISEMEMRGFKYVPDSSAQLYVSYVAGAYDLNQAGTMGPLSQTPASNPSEMNQSRTWSRESRQGMMVIDIADAHKKDEIWSATGSLTIDGVDINRVLEGMIYKAFKKFPNKNKKKKR